MPSQKRCLAAIPLVAVPFTVFTACVQDFSIHHQEFALLPELRDVAAARVATIILRDFHATRYHGDKAVQKDDEELS